MRELAAGRISHFITNVGDGACSESGEELDLSYQDLANLRERYVSITRSVALLCLRSPNLRISHACGLAAYLGNAPDQHLNADWL